MFVRQVILIIILLQSSLTFSQSADLEAVKIHGFLAQGIIDVDGSNYVNDDGELSAELTELGINASYQLSKNIRVAGQAVYLNGGNRYEEGVRIDYLLADWSFYTDDNWQMNLYLGRVKNYHWLYSSTRDVPMTRPTIVLPQSVYFDGTRDMSVGGDGALLTAKYFSNDFGEFDFNISSSKSPISDKQSKVLMGDFSNGDLKHDRGLQASIYWQPELSNWRFGLALTDADFSYNEKGISFYTDGDLALKRYYFNGVYNAENWIFSFELLQEQMVVTDLLSVGFNSDVTGQGGFIQAEYQVNSDLKLLTRYERFYGNKDDKNGKKWEKASYGTIPHYFGYQNDAVLGLSYNLGTNLQLQLEHHWVKGTARLLPVVIPNPIMNDQEHWQISAMQLMYWF